MEWIIVGVVLLSAAYVQGLRRKRYYHYILARYDLDNLSQILSGDALISYLMEIEDNFRKYNSLPSWKDGIVGYNGFNKRKNSIYLGSEPSEYYDNFPNDDSLIYELYSEKLSEAEVINQSVQNILRPTLKKLYSELESLRNKPAKFYISEYKKAIKDSQDDD